MNKQDVQQALVSGTSLITFTKKDGTERVMKATLQADVITPYEKKTDRVKTVNEDILSVWDLDKDAWRSVTISSITSMVSYLDGEVNAV